MAFPEFSKFALGHSKLQQEVVCMAVGLTHDGQIKIYGDDLSASREQHLC